MNVIDLTGDKGAFFLKPVADGSNGRNIHEPQTETTHNPIGDLWRKRMKKKRVRMKSSPSTCRHLERKLTQI